MELDYTNSPLVSYTKLSPSNSGQRKHAIDTITPHCVVGQATVEGLGDYFYPAANQVSSNYGIGCDGRVGMYVEEKNRSWCSSSADNDNRAITIECASDTKEPYAFRDAVYETLIRLCTDICQRYGKKKLLWMKDKDKTLAYQPAEDEMVLTVHRWFYAQKSCPGTWMMNHMDDLAEKVTAALNEEPAPIDEPVQDVPDINDGKITASAGLQALDLSGQSTSQIVDTVGPLCTEDQRRTGILASVTMAQFILESGYCRTELARAANNCFGMKTNLSGNDWPGSAWDGKSVYLMDTEEYLNGEKHILTESFRKYACIEDSIADHSAYLLGAMKDGSPRYDGLAGCTDYRQAAHIIKDGGYATAPEYVDYLCNLIEIWGLTKWDIPVPKNEQQDNQDEQQEPLFPDTQSGDTVTIPVSDWNAIKAAVVVAYQAVRKHDDVG